MTSLIFLAELDHLNFSNLCVSKIWNVDVTAAVSCFGLWDNLWALQCILWSFALWFPGRSMTAPPLLEYLGNVRMTNVRFNIDVQSWNTGNRILDTGGCAASCKLALLRFLGNNTTDHHSHTNWTLKHGLKMFKDAVPAWRTWREGAEIQLAK